MVPRHIVAGVALALVLAAVVAGLFIVGSPSNERARRLDEQRVGALQNISAMVDSYWTAHSSLPASLAALANDPRLSVDTKDPETREEYGYRTRSEREYELCATFDRETGEDPSSPFWTHGAGRRCFEIEARALGK